MLIQVFLLYITLYLCKYIAAVADALFILVRRIVISTYELQRPTTFVTTLYVHMVCAQGKIN